MPAEKELVGERDTPTGRSLFLARPISADKPCLECHDRARTAPPALIRRYGSANGFGWKEGEIIGAQIVSVPMAVPVHMADVAFRDLLVYLVAIFLVSMILLDILLVLTIVRPAARLAAIADQVSTGNLDAPELTVTGKDEISMLAGSFIGCDRDDFAGVAGAGGVGGAVVTGVSQCGHSRQLASSGVLQRRQALFSLVPQ